MLYAMPVKILTKMFKIFDNEICNISGDETLFLFGEDDF